MTSNGPTFLEVGQENKEKIVNILTFETVQGAETLNKSRHFYYIFIIKSCTNLI
jgi:hypothetical protein